MLSLFLNRIRERRKLFCTLIEKIFRVVFISPNAEKMIFELVWCLHWRRIPISRKGHTERAAKRKREKCMETRVHDYVYFNKVK